jgi:hypothetical protein
MTDIDNQCIILGDFYINYKNDSAIGDFIEFNDIGLPLAFLKSEGLCELNNNSEVYIQETFNLLLATLGVDDIGYDSLEHLLSTAEEKSK